MDKQSISYLKDEYVLLQGMYEDYDRRSLTIKSWVSAAAIAGIGLGFGKTPNPKIWVVVAVISACIWYLEGRWKMFQHGLRDRIRIIEATFRNDPELLIKNTKPFQIYFWWFKTHRLDEPIYKYEKAFRPRPFFLRLIASMWQDFVFIPYLPVIIICVWFYVVQTML